MIVNRHPKGVTAGGRFAPGSHTEPEVSLTARDASEEPALKLQELDWAENLHGTYDADSARNYYPVMAKVFDAARNHVESTPGGKDELASRARANKLTAQAEKLADITGVPAREIRNFHSEMAGIEPGTPEWEETVRLWSQDIWNEPRNRDLHRLQHARK